LFVHIFNIARFRGKLQYGRFLAFTQASEEHDLPVGELRRGGLCASLC
jgi:hypothetical protein